MGSSNSRFVAAEPTLRLRTAEANRLPADGLMTATKSLDEVVVDRTGLRKSSSWAGPRIARQTCATLRRWDERAEKVAQLDGSVESCTMRARISEGSEMIVAAIFYRVVWREPTAASVRSHARFQIPQLVPSTSQIFKTI